MQPRNPGMIRWPVDIQLYAAIFFLALTTQVCGPLMLALQHAMKARTHCVRQYILSSDIMSQTSKEVGMALEFLG
jgi:hypothetical protein